MTPIRLAALTSAAMVAFAANSVLCRMSLGAGLIDASSFTSIRLLAGAICLVLIVWLRDRTFVLGPPRIISVIALFVYMVGFSFAYRSLSTGTGALLLFGFVQLTMLGTALYRGERWSPTSWVGMVAAMAGLVYLVLPGLQAPQPLYCGLMGIAGLAWGLYSLKGAGGGDPTQATASNFVYATPLALVASGVDYSQLSISGSGALLAIASGAIASGIGYAIWYTALDHLRSAAAAIIQLCVPALAAGAGILLLAEPLSARIVIATLLTLGGIALVLLSKPTERA